MELKPGYKLTEVVVIPEEWEVKPLGDVVDFLDGRRRPVKDSERAKMQGDIPYYGASGIVDYVNDFLFDEELILLGEDGENILSRNCRLAFKISGKTWVNNHAHVLRPKTGVLLDYLVEFLESRDYAQYNTGTAQPKLNKLVCSKIPVLYPPLPEQRAIATALSDMDELLGALDRLIAKKRDLKQAAMQQLLTGKTRLPGFGEGKGYKQTEIGEIPEDWNLLKIADVVENSRLPSGIYKEQRLYGDGNKIIKIGDVFNFDYFEPNQAQRVVLSNGEISKYRAKVGDIFIALASVKLEGVGKVMLVKELDEETAFDHNVALIRVNERTLPNFLFYLLKSNIIRQQVGQSATQVGTTFLKASTILSFQLPAPIEKTEQTAIATILSDMDAEIAALEQRRDKTRTLKQAMMQELLTGKTRLVSPGEVYA